MLLLGYAWSETYRYCVPARMGFAAPAASLVLSVVIEVRSSYPLAKNHPTGIESYLLGQFLLSSPPGGWREFRP